MTTPTLQPPAQEKDHRLAFPWEERDANGQFRQEFGMELRDWFAGQAMKNPSVFEPSAQTESINKNAAFAYRIADAMMEARKV